MIRSYNLRFTGTLKTFRPEFIKSERGLAVPYRSSRYRDETDPQRLGEWAVLGALRGHHREICDQYESFKSSPTKPKSLRLGAKVADYVELRERWKAELIADRDRMMAASIPKLVQKLTRCREEFQTSEEETLGASHLPGGMW
jgi:hypothetical protein